LSSGEPGSLTPDRMDILDKIARVLSVRQDPEGAVRLSLEALVPRFADIAVLVRTQDGGGADEAVVTVAHREPEKIPEVVGLVQPLLPSICRLATKDALRGRQFRWVARVARSTIAFLSGEPAVARALHTLEVTSFIAIPLPSTGRPIGGLAFLRNQNPLPFHAADLALAHMTGRRIAATIRDTEHRSLKKWIQVFDHAGWGAVIVEGKHRRIAGVNPAFAQLHGFPGPESLVGRPYRELLASENADQPAHWSTQAKRSAYEAVHVRADGTPFPVLTAVTPLVDDTGETSYVVTIQDLTDLKRAEERLRRAQRLEAVGRLAGGVAHEVNNMMTIILGFSDLLARSGEVPVQRHRDLEEIRKAATRAGKITQQLLAFSRQQILQPTDLKVNDVIADLVPVLRLLLPANIEVQTALAPLSPVVRADRAHLDQVIINLAFNARDAMAGGGILRLVTESRRLDESDGERLIGIPIRSGQYALISVVDTGHGMDPPTIQQVFEPFFTTKPAGSGTGLGLATVYGVVKQSGGYVWVESSVGSGTTVTVCLPKSAVEVEGPGEGSVGQGPLECRPGTVLVIEDEDGVRDLVHRVLQDQGHQVLAAADGDGALALLENKERALDLVLSDIIVPGIGTSELDQKIRELRPEVPVLYMSGYSREEMIERGLIDPGRPFLQKPFTAEELTEVVCRELGTEVGTRVVER
jgi:two-component system, cell cycle sensor histidine kinase and response regulator CckA